MSKASQIVILCEDKAHEVFAKRFLKKSWNVNHRSIRVIPYPRSGKGSGKQYVLNNVSKEVNALRSRQASTILLVIQDADELSVEEMKSHLDERISPCRGDEENIAYIIPKWHIETWVAYLDGMSVCEKEKYKNKYGKISVSKEIHSFIDYLSDKCKNNAQLISPPQSLASACQEFSRIRNAL